MKKNNLLEKNIENIAKKAKSASRILSLVSTEDRNKALRQMAEAITGNINYLKKENKKDIDAALKLGISSALIDRLTLNDKRIQAMAQSLLDTAELNDPLGQIIEIYKRPNGLVIKKVRVPIGVVGIIYESRPNVTSDCIGLCLKSGNAVILKGGKEAVFSNKAIFIVMQKALAATNLPKDAISIILSADRDAVKYFLSLDKYIDLIVPRGGEGLIRFVSENSSIPVVKHYKGVCHTYVSGKADLDMAHNICFNAKVQRPGVCNAMEKMLVNSNVAEKFLPKMIKSFQEAGVEIRACDKTRKIVKGLKKASLADWDDEYLDLILTVKIVEDLKEAIEHINKHGSMHSDAIVTKDAKEAEEFLKAVDSACVYVNASTRFTDGYEFGFGAEVGISTDKIHVRGPMGLEGLTTYKYEIYGSGQVRN